MKKLLNATTAVAVSLAMAYNFYFAYDFVHVETEKGILRGYNTTTWRGTRYYAFKGIPYAKPPLGKLRFKAPQEEAAWVGVRDALTHGSVCPQQLPVVGFLRGDEDCLFLNVYTPSLEDEGLPVMVWIHGGVFSLGSGNDEEFGPDYFIDAGVIVVTMNYRLGALGFLSTGDDGAPGNAGMKDQVAALKWVRRNIGKFGGNPNNVTLFGESAGSVSVHFHLLSPMSSGLFANAIGQSGTSLAFWTWTENPVECTVRLAEALRAKNLSNDTTKALEFLKTVPYRDIVRAQGRSLLTESEERRLNLILFKPVVEKNVSSEEVFLPDSPLNILESGNFNKVPYITGYNDKEGYMVFTGQHRRRGKKKQFLRVSGSNQDDVTLSEILKPKAEFGAFNDTERYLPNFFRDEGLRTDLAETIRRFYFKDRPVGKENMTNLVDLYTDICFTSGIRRATQLQLRSGTSPIYAYVFSYDGGLNYAKRTFFINLPGACHGDDLGYLFHPKLMFWRKPSEGSEDEYLINTMIRLWTNFAKYGNPTPRGDPLIWKPTSLDEFSYLNISGRDTKLAVNPDHGRNKLWAEAYERDAAIRQRDGSTPRT